MKNENINETVDVSEGELNNFGIMIEIFLKAVIQKHTKKDIQPSIFQITNQISTIKNQ